MRWFATSATGPMDSCDFCWDEQAYAYSGFVLCAEHARQFADGRLVAPYPAPPREELAELMAVEAAL
jgi:hypothetical protein